MYYVICYLQCAKHLFRLKKWWPGGPVGMVPYLPTTPNCSTLNSAPKKDKKSCHEQGARVREKSKQVDINT